MCILCRPQSLLGKDFATNRCTLSLSDHFGHHQAHVFSFLFYVLAPTVLDRIRHIELHSQSESTLLAWPTVEFASISALTKDKRGLFFSRDKCQKSQVCLRTLLQHQQVSVASH